MGNGKEVTSTDRYKRRHRYQRRRRNEMAEPEVVVATDDLQQEGWAVTFPKSMDELSYTYQSAPARYKLMVCCAARLHGVQHGQN